MRILFAADGSEYTKRALAFLMTHETLTGPLDELIVFNVQVAFPTRVVKMVDANEVKDFHREESDKVFAPIKLFLDAHAVPYRCLAAVGPLAAEIVRAAHTEKVDLILMGTHGYGVMGRALMGSVAHGVIADSDVPVLLVK
jgi:nucleotide-binding universal stress UspA family protein